MRGGQDGPTREAVLGQEAGPRLRAGWGRVGSDLLDPGEDADFGPVHGNGTTRNSAARPFLPCPGPGSRPTRTPPCPAPERLAGRRRRCGAGRGGPSSDVPSDAPASVPGHCGRSGSRTRPLRHPHGRRMSPGVCGDISASKRPRARTEPSRLGRREQRRPRLRHPGRSADPTRPPPRLVRTQRRSPLRRTQAALTRAPTARPRCCAAARVAPRCPLTCPPGVPRGLHRTAESGRGSGRAQSRPPGPAPALRSRDATAPEPATPPDDNQASSPHRCPHGPAAHPVSRSPRRQRPPPRSEPAAPQTPRPRIL